jgi:hypothetical protein
LAGIEIKSGKIREVPDRFYMSSGGSVGTDTVPAMLTPGEFVVNKDAAAKHYSLLSHINKGVS